MDIFEVKTDLWWCGSSDVGILEPLYLEGDYINKVKEMPDDVLFKGRVGYSTKEEFLYSEQLMENILNGLDENWTITEKAAYLYSKLGDVNSFDPRATIINEREDADKLDCEFRSLWHNLKTQRSVCNGIIDIYRMLLERAGIKSEELNGNRHVYCLVYDENGQSILTDPTWDMMNLMYGYQPEYFGISYEQMQQAEKKVGKTYHKLEDESILGNIRIIDKDELREINKKTGNMVQYDGKYYYRAMKFFRNLNLPSTEEPETAILSVIRQFQEHYGDKSKKLGEMLKVIPTVCLRILGLENVKADGGFVYRKGDGEKNPILVTRIDYKGKYDGKPSTYLVNDESEFEIKSSTLEQLENEFIDFNSQKILYNSKERENKLEL